MAISSHLTQFAILSLLIAAYDERTDLDGIGDWAPNRTLSNINAPRLGTQLDILPGASC